MTLQTVERAIAPNPLPPIIRHGYTPAEGSPAEVGVPVFVSEDERFS